MSKKLTNVVEQVSKVTTIADSAKQLANTNASGLQDINQAYEQLSELFVIKQQENEARQAEQARAYQREIQELKDREFQNGIENTSLAQKVSMLEQQLHIANDRIDELVRNIQAVEGQKDSLLSQNQTLIKENRRYRQQNEKLVNQILSLGGRPNTTGELSGANLPIGDNGPITNSGSNSGSGGGGTGNVI